MSDTTLRARPPVALDCIYYAAAIGFVLFMFYYYWTGLGGPVVLAMGMIPCTFVLFTLRALRQNDFYPSLPAAANYAIGAAYCAFALYCGYYMHENYMSLGLERSGMWNTADLIFGGGMTLLVIEYARKRHMPLFILNIVVILYAVYGYMVPGMFHHAGVSWTRIISASSLEMETGIFSILPQLALTIVGSFMLVLSLLQGYGCIDSLLRATKRVATRSSHAIPQSSVVGSMAIGTISGSGAANSITVGSATIPAMIGAGMPRATAAAIESASSMGGQLMPPVMGIAAFIMAEFLGVSYFEVVARGWVPALIYYFAVALSVYLLATHHHARMATYVDAPKLGWRDMVNLGAFACVVGGLIALMGTIFLPPMFAALYVFCAIGPVLLIVNTVPLLGPGRWSFAAFLAPLRRFLDAFIDMISDIALLLATLSIMTGALVITGVPTKLGTLLVDAAGVNLAAMVLMAFIFGAILGTGLPTVPTYILVAIVIAPPFIKMGVNPWVVHFFAFFMGVFGELTPPTSITSAITAKIADASFYTTMWRAMQICVALFTLMAGVFVRPELVIEPGLQQMVAALLILVATAGLTFSIHARFSERFFVDGPVRLLLAAAALVALLHPSEQVAGLACVPVLLVTGYWLLRRRVEQTAADAGTGTEGRALQHGPDKVLLDRGRG